jgi:hypothetical protein
LLLKKHNFYLNLKKKLTDQHRLLLLNNHEKFQIDNEIAYFEKHQSSFSSAEKKRKTDELRARISSLEGQNSKIQTLLRAILLGLTNVFGKYTVFSR